MISRPRANLLIYHGAFAPRGCCRGAKAGEAGEDAAREAAPANGAGAGDQPVDASAAAAAGAVKIVPGVGAAAAASGPTELPRSLRTPRTAVVCPPPEFSDLAAPLSV